tara:strand:+ start:1893 stop:2138 length:246 start_codon:yes stop_codon:yes gene_type:complete
MSSQLDNVKDMLGEIKGDNSIPRNIRSKIDGVLIEIGNNDCDVDIKVSRLLNELEEISEDPNLPSYIRAEILMTIGILSEN